MRHEADILLATTIIENGLDIPLCNTIIINRADRHGLSELYQLRGRVGRSDRRAYAYLLIPPDRELSELARRRLAALKEFSDLGAGFKIAALDLELRGAGNLLGGEQSGHIEAVGFELYTTMLERTVRELKGEIEEEVPETQLNLGLNIRIPSEYITEENQRLRMYKRVAGVESESALGRCRRRTRRPLRRAAAGGSQSAGLCSSAFAVAAHRGRADRTATGGRQYSLYREGDGRSRAPGTVRRQRNRSAVHTRRRVEVHVEREAGRAGIEQAEGAAGTTRQRAAAGRMNPDRVPRSSPGVGLGREAF